MKYFMNMLMAVLITTTSAPASITGASDPVQTNLEELERKRLHKQQFYEAIELEITEAGLQNKTKPHPRLYNKTEYDEFVREIKAAQTLPSNQRKARHYYLLNNYEIMKVSDVERVIKKREKEEDPILYLVPYDDMFDYIYDIHKTVGHKGKFL